MATPHSNPPPKHLEPEDIFAEIDRSLRKIALYQKVIIVCLSIIVIGVFTSSVVPPQLTPFLVTALLLVSFSCTLFTLLLAHQIYGPGIAILLALFLLAPYLYFVMWHFSPDLRSLHILNIAYIHSRHLELIVLLVINHKATRTLKQNGIKVGLLGANLTTLPTQPQTNPDPP